VGGSGPGDAGNLRTTCARRLLAGCAGQLSAVVLTAACVHVGGMEMPAAVAAREATAIALASMTFPPFLNWAENAKSVAQRHHKDPRFASLQLTARAVVQTHGLRRLATTAIGTSLTREICYNTSRWMLYSSLRRKNMSTPERFATGFLSGLIGSFVANPFDLVRVRQQSRAMLACRPPSGMEEARKVIMEAAQRQRRLPIPHLVLWNGWQVNCLRSALFTSGSMATYELCKATLTKQHWTGGREGPVVHIISGFAMGVAGTLMYMPADVVRARCYNQAPAHAITTTDIVRITRSLYTTGGLSAFYRGTGAALARTVPACIVFPVAMECSRKAVGLDYF